MVRQAIKNNIKLDHCEIRCSKYVFAHFLIQFEIEPIYNCKTILMVYKVDSNRKGIDWVPYHVMIKISKT